MAQASTGTPTTLRYLTVQDMLWINLQVTKKVNSFDYAKLEEAVFYQYSYGQSADLFKQATYFARNFVAERPFSRGNVATAFVGWLTFLYLNGFAVDVRDEIAGSWFDGLTRGEKDIAEDFRGAPGAYDSTEGAAEAILCTYEATIRELASRD